MLLISKFNSIGNAAAVLEKDLNIKLPNDYAGFLDKYNGGLTYNTTLKSGRRKDMISGFYGVGDVDKNYGFDGMKSMGVLERYLDKQMLPVAGNMNGDEYCLSLSGEDYGSIYLIYHDLLGKKKAIASSFSEFIQKCRSEEIGHVPTMKERKRKNENESQSQMVLKTK